MLHFKRTAASVAFFATPAKPRDRCCGVGRIPHVRPWICHDVHRLVDAELTVVDCVEPVAYVRVRKGAVCIVMMLINKNKCGYHDSMIYMYIYGLGSEHNHARTNMSECKRAKGTGLLEVLNTADTVHTRTRTRTWHTIIVLTMSGICTKNENRGARHTRVNVVAERALTQTTIGSQTRRSKSTLPTRRW
jgi:hypothetical protein